MKLKSKTKEQFALINRNKLRGLLVENGYTYTTISKELSISRMSFYNKVSGIALFNEHEIYLLRRFFGNDIFLD